MADCNLEIGTDKDFNLEIGTDKDFYDIVHNCETNEYYLNGSQVRLKFLRMVPAQLNQGTEAGVVRVHEGRLFVRAGDGDMEILELQPECKPPMLARAFIAGHRDIDGARLV